MNQAQALPEGNERGLVDDSPYHQHDRHGCRRALPVDLMGLLETAP